MSLIKEAFLSKRALLSIFYGTAVSAGITVGFDYLAPPYAPITNRCTPEVAREAVEKSLNKSIIGELGKAGCKRIEIRVEKERLQEASEYARNIEQYLGYSDLNIIANAPVRFGDETGEMDDFTKRVIVLFDSTRQKRGIRGSEI